MGTGAVALLFHNFPYGGPNNPALRGLFMAFYMLNFVRPFSFLWTCFD
jgi:hypothetical protein